jgi:Domain of unknown function (DUF4160)
MYFRDHPRPHFHARYGGHVAEIAIDALKLTDGSLPPRLTVRNAPGCYASMQPASTHAASSQSAPSVKVSDLQGLPQWSQPTLVSAR